MINKFFADKDYNIELLVNMEEPWQGEEIWQNNIIVRVNADSTANQYLLVTGNNISTNLPVTPGQVNEIDIPMAYWELSGETTIQPYKNGSAVSGRDITISFPDVINGAGMISKVNETIGYVYSMSGTQYPEEEVKDVKETVDQHTQEIDDLQRNKQNFIDEDLNTPSGTAEEGDLIFVGATGNSDKEVYRYENGAWVKVNLGTKVEANPSGDASVRLNKLQVGDTIYSIPQDGHIYSTEEHLVGKWTNGNDVYERTYFLNQIPTGSATMQYAHGIGGIGLVIDSKGQIVDTGRYTNILCNNLLEVTDLKIELTARAAQTGVGFVTIQYMKPTGGYYTGNRFYESEITPSGLYIVTGWGTWARKTVAGDCYVGMLVAYYRPWNYLFWRPFCLSKLEATANGMSYRDGKATGHITYDDGNTWYYSMDQENQSYASSMTIDNTQPQSKRFYYGEMNPISWTDMLYAVLDEIYYGN